MDFQAISSPARSRRRTRSSQRARSLAIASSRTMLSSMSTPLWCRGTLEDFSRRGYEAWVTSSISYCLGLAPHCTCMHGMTAILQGRRRRTLWQWGYFRPDSYRHGRGKTKERCIRRPICLDSGLPISPRQRLAPSRRWFDIT